MKAKARYLSVGLVLALALSPFAAPGVGNAPVAIAQTAEAELENAIALNRQVRTLYAEGKYAEATPLAEEMLEILRRVLGARPEVAAGLNQLALLYQAQGRYDEAEPLFRESLGILQGALDGDRPEIAIGLNNLGALSRDRGRYDEAGRYFQQALEMWQRLHSGDHPEVATALNNVAVLYEAQSRFAEAEPLHLRALEMRQRVFEGDHPQVADSLNNVGAFYQLQGRSDEALPLFEQALAMRRRLAEGGDRPDVAASLNNLAALYESRGDYVEAERLYRSALEMRERLFAGDHPEVADALNNLAYLSYLQGRYEAAKPLYERSLVMRQRVYDGDHPDVADSLNNLALLLQAQKQYAEAEPLFVRALEMFERLFEGDAARVAIALNNLGYISELQGRFADAEAPYREALEMKRRVYDGDHPSVATSLNNLAGLYRILNRDDESEALFVEALEMRERSPAGNEADIAVSSSNLAILNQGLGRYDRALEYFTRAAEAEEAVLARNLLAGTEAEKRQFLQLFSGNTDSTISFHLQDVPSDREAAELALTTILRRKGRILDVMGESFGLLRERLSDEDRVLFNRLTETYEEISSLSARADSEGDRLQRLTAEAAVLEKQLLDRSAIYRREIFPVTIAAVQNEMPEDAALIEFVAYQPYNPEAKLVSERFGDTRYVAYVLLPDGTLNWHDYGDTAEIDELIRQFHLNLRRSWEAYGRDLHDRLFAPIQPKLGSATHLLVAPDSTLNLLPFNALLDLDETLLLERYQITYLTSGRDLLRMEERTTQRQPPLLIADPTFDDARPDGNAIASRTRGGNQRSATLVDMTFGSLEFAKAEAEAIAPLFPELRTLTGAEATENALKQARSPQFLHVATHGFFEGNRTPIEPIEPDSEVEPYRGENPLLLSGLALAGFNDRASGNEDGVLTALEVTGLDLLDTQLVVLSACDTGLGAIEQGEGVYGLRRAFTLAGAQSQVMSLWNVDDESTKELMVKYYERLKAGEGRSEALRQVQIEMASDPYWSSPYFWAAFIPTGNWRSLDAPPS